jgi:nucleoside-diphosphate-sugar epimerase
MRLVVTGVHSVLGQAVVELALARGHYVTPTEQQTAGGPEDTSIGASRNMVPPRTATGSVDLGVKLPVTVVCALSHPGAAGAPTREDGLEVDEMLSSADCVIHIAPLLARLVPQLHTWLDDATRCTYNLLGAAAASGTVRRVVLASSMAIFASYDDALAVETSYAPMPTTAPAQLGPHLAEFTAREFAREADLPVLARGDIVILTENDSNDSNTTM